MKKKEPVITLTKEEIKNSAEALKQYLSENLEIEVGNLQSEIFLDYITEKIGIIYYNKGVMDSMHMIKEKSEDLYLLLKEE